MLDGSLWHLSAREVVHAAVDSVAMAPEPKQRLQDISLMYNVRSTINQLTGEYYGPNTLGLLKEALTDIGG